MSWPVVLGMGYKKIETKFQVLVSCQCIITSSFYVCDTPKSSIMSIPFALQSQYLHRLCIRLAKHYHCIKSYYYIISSNQLQYASQIQWSSTYMIVNITKYLILYRSTCYLGLALATAGSHLMICKWIDDYYCGFNFILQVSICYCRQVIATAN